MTNEWLEFKAYTDKPVFNATDKHSTAFMGRFTTTMIKKNKGFNRILTILARGFPFHNNDGTLRNDDVYLQAGDARDFLCAWCSIPTESVTDKNLKFHTSFPELNSKFPNIVDKNGAGWYYRYLHAFPNTYQRTRTKLRKNCIYLLKRKR